MHDLFTELNEKEFDFLEHFLLYRIDDDDHPLDMDEGVLGMDELDGLLSAVVSGPVAIQAAQWLPLVWGDFPPAWKNPAEFEQVFSLMVRHLNGIAHCLMETPEEFAPVFKESVVKGRTVLVVDDWCEGFLRGMSLASEAWQAGGEEMTVLLSPILAFTESGNWSGHEQGDAKMEALQLAIAPHLRAIHRYWLERRSEERQAPRRTQPRVGRNDPCPCGSGKKYKKCCLH